MTAKMQKAMGKAVREDMAGRISNALNQIKAKGGRIIDHGSRGIILAELPSSSLAEIASIPEISLLDTPRKSIPFMNNSVAKVQASTFWNPLNGGYTGAQSAVDVAVLDRGVDPNHPALSGHRFMTNISPDLWSNPGWWWSGYGPWHGTLVAGIIASQDSVYKGVAYGLDYILAAYSLGSQQAILNSVDWALTDPNVDPAEAVNFSGGQATSYYPYDWFAKEFDKRITQHNVLTVTVTGNSPPTVDVQSPGVAYNTITVGAVNDLDDPITYTNQYIWIHSQRGPTGDNRKKPDLVAPGSSYDGYNEPYWDANGAYWPNSDPDHGIFSTDIRWRTDEDFTANSGTSFAAPHVTGGVLLLADSGIISHLAQKAILINSAVTFIANDPNDSGDDEYLTEGSHWDGSYGWGSLHLGLACMDRNNCLYSDGNNSIRIYPVSSQGETHYQLFHSCITSWCKATLVWDMHPQPEPAVSKLNNLDLDLWLEDDNSRLAYSDSNRDNVEQVGPSSLESGYFDGIIKVYTPDENFEVVDYEEYALAIDNIYGISPLTRINGPDHQITISPPPIVKPGQNFTITARGSGILVIANRIRIRSPSTFLMGLPLIRIILSKLAL